MGTVVAPNDRPLENQNDAIIFHCLPNKGSSPSMILCKQHKISDPKRCRSPFRHGCHGISGSRSTKSPSPLGSTQGRGPHRSRKAIPPTLADKHSRSHHPRRRCSGRRGGTGPPSRGRALWTKALGGDTCLKDA